MKEDTMFRFRISMIVPIIIWALVLILDHTAFGASINPGGSETVSCAPCPVCPGTNPLEPIPACVNMPFPNKVNGYMLGPSKSVCFSFDLTIPIRNNLQIGASSTDWQGNVDIGVSDLRAPSCDEIKSYRLPPDGPPWYAPTGDSNETVYIMRGFLAGTKVYVTFCNRRTDANAGFNFYWGGW
jgi:hypothetical protein